MNPLMFDQQLQIKAKKIPLSHFESFWEDLLFEDSSFFFAGFSSAKVVAPPDCIGNKR